MESKNPKDFLCPGHDYTINGLEKAIRAVSKECEIRNKIIYNHSETLAKIPVQLSETRSDVRDIKVMLFGNGQPGLLQRITRLEGKIFFLWALLFLVLGGLITAVLQKIF